MMSFLASSIVIRAHIQSDDTNLIVKKKSRTNPLNNIVEEEEIHHNAFDFLQNTTLIELKIAKIGESKTNSYQEHAQEVIVPPPEIC